MEMTRTGSRERAVMERALALGERASRYLGEACGASAAEIDLAAAAKLVQAAHRDLTPEARMLELQALVRRWVRAGRPGRRAA